jgi:transcriptional regulator GlxA family with amidase domain
MHPGHSYEAKQDISARLGVTFIHFSVLSKNSTILRLSDFEPPFEVMRTRQVGFIDALMRRIVDLDSEPNAEASARQLMKALIIELDREHHNTPSHEPLGTEQHHREIILATAAKIRESPAETPAIVELAHAAGYSVDHFSRIFMQVIGLRPQHYIIQSKIERAGQLLLESNLTIGAISEAVGFQDIFYFSRQLKQKVGQSPSQYRRALRLA